MILICRWWSIFWGAISFKPKQWQRIRGKMFYLWSLSSISVISERTSPLKNPPFPQHHSQLKIELFMFFLPARSTQTNTATCSIESGVMLSNISPVFARVNSIILGFGAIGDPSLPFSGSCPRVSGSPRMAHLNFRKYSPILRSRASR
jgi:hypothetical protein